MIKPYNITVPYVPVNDFDWSFTRTGPLPWNQTVWSLLAVFTALPLWTTVELTVWVFYTFRKWSGLYFWSVLITTWGVTLHAIGFILKFCVPDCNWIFSTVLAEIGWVSMVSGFSVVLYSRLHLVVRNPRVLQLTLAMIITDAFLLHVPTIVFQFGTSNKSTHTKYLPFMGPMERVQVMGFSIQETIISVIYITATLKMLKGSFNKKIRNTTAFLVLIQIIVILSDVLVIGLDYAEYFTLKAVIHSFVYAFKLQLEFVILNEFKAVSQGGIAPRELEDISDSSPSTSPHKAGGRKWWRPNEKTNNEDESPRRHGIGQTHGWQDTSSDGGSTVGAAITVHSEEIARETSSRGFDLTGVKPYMAGITDTVEGESRYLGAFDRIERRA